MTTTETVRPAIPAARYAARLAAARELLATRGAAALLVGVGSDLDYLTGYRAHLLERLTMLVLPAEASPVLVAPRLEALPARGCPAAAGGAVEVATWEETEDPYGLVAGLVRAGGGAAGAGGEVLVSDRLWSMHVLALQDRLAGTRMGLATPVTGELRLRKDGVEVELLRLAAHAADRACLAVASGRLVGRTEAEVARDVLDRLVAEGHDEAAFAIVASGPNSASPHHDPGERRIEAGEPIVLDIGGVLGGYNSDMTRTIWVTGGDVGRGPDPEFLALHGVLEEAQAAAVAAVRPGVAGEAIDGVARERIAAAGYGDRFIHRTGHGIGLEGHEEPYLVAGSHRPLEVGMAFSVEPGIYLEGRFGARIEDIVACGLDGPDVLNRAPRSLLVVDG